MALFESYERRIDQINAALAKYDIKSIEEAKAICDEKGINVYDIVKSTQPICFENACWAYTVGAAMAIKNGDTKAEDAAKVDDEVTVLVKKIDRENRRVALSIKATQEDPWLTEASAFKEGMVIEGTVERFLPFGAIVKLADKVEGLVHVSEIAETRVEKPEDILEIGQNVKVKVIKVDLKHKKIGLSIVKAVKEAENGICCRKNPGTFFPQSCTAAFERSYRTVPAGD